MTNSDPTPQSNPRTEEPKGKWHEQKNKLKAKFSILTDEDLQFEDGKKDMMMDKLQQKLGKTKQELEAIISTL